jgi:hypothetical protein
MVTEVCGGTMTWGSFNDEEEDAHAQLDKLWELGVNFLDTAELYPVGWNYGALTEKWMGNWLGASSSARTRASSPAAARDRLGVGCHRVCGVVFRRRRRRRRRRAPVNAEKASSASQPPHPQRSAATKSCSGGAPADETKTTFRVLASRLP